MVKRIRSSDYAANPQYGRLKKFKRFTKSRMQAKQGQVALIKKIISNQAEAKEVLTYLSATLNATQSYISLLNAVAEGTDYNTRVGRSITHKYIHLQMSIVMNADVTAADQAYGETGFWSIVFDRQSNGAAPAFGDIYDTLGGTVPPGLAHRNTGNFQDRFKVVCHEDFALGSNNKGVAVTGGGTGAVPYRCNKYIDLTNWKGGDQNTKFLSNAATINAIDTGAFFLIVAGQYVTATNTAFWSANVKYRFTDM